MRQSLSGMNKRGIGITKSNITVIAKLFVPMCPACGDGGELEDDSQQLAYIIDNTVSAILSDSSGTVMQFSEK